MAYNAVFEREAAHDLDSIIEYIAVELCNPTAAQSLLLDIMKIIDVIKNFPFGFPISKYKQSADNEIRQTQTKNFAIFYSVENTTVFILRIKYAKSDLTKIEIKE